MQPPELLARPSRADWGTDEEGRDNHARVAAVHAQLTAAGLRCWFDEEQMQGDINSKMTSGIDDSAVVVCFITSRYVTKVSGDGPNGDDDNCAPCSTHSCLCTTRNSYTRRNS